MIPILASDLQPGWYRVEKALSRDGQEYWGNWYGPYRSPQEAVINRAVDRQTSLITHVDRVYDSWTIPGGY